MGNRILSVIIAILPIVLVASVPAQEYKPEFPRAGANKIQESDRLVAWKVSWEKGKSTGMHKIALDQVLIFLADGAIKITRPDGTWSVEEERLGSVRFESKGTVVAEEGFSETPSEAVIIQVKDTALKPWPVTEGIPGQFPRIGTVKLFETDRFNVWDQTWRPGKLIAAHLHYHEVVAVFLVGGELRVFTKDATPPVHLSRKRGDLVIQDSQIPAPHLEEEVKGIPRAIWIELKN